MKFSRGSRGENLSPYQDPVRFLIFVTISVSGGPELCARLLKERFSLSPPRPPSRKWGEKCLIVAHVIDLDSVLDNALLFSYKMLE